MDTGTPGTSREIYSEDADDGTRVRGIASSSPSSTLNPVTENYTRSPFKLYRGWKRSKNGQAGSCWLEMGQYGVKGNNVKPTGIDLILSILLITS